MDHTVSIHLDVVGSNPHKCEIQNFFSFFLLIILYCILLKYCKWIHKVKKGFIKQAPQAGIDPRIYRSWLFHVTTTPILYLMNNTDFYYKEVQYITTFAFSNTWGRGRHNERGQSECNSHYSNFRTQRAPMAFLKTLWKKLHRLTSKENVPHHNTFI